VLFEKLTVAKLIKKLTAFIELIEFTTARHWILS
jgi:hypothetical protein